MQEEQASPEVGSFTFEVFGSGRGSRRRASQFRVRCDAISMHGEQLLLLSVLGPETSVKALTAGLCSSNKDQRRIAYAAAIGEINATHLARCPGGYRIYRTKLDYGLWHVLCLAKREGFLPVLSEETLWRHLQSEAFTTPLVRGWMPWLLQAMKDREVIVPLTQHGCQAGLLLADDAILDELVREGIQQGHLSIDGWKVDSLAPEEPAQDDDIDNLDDYMLRYGPLLGQQAERSLEPLHVPGRDPLPKVDLLRVPFEAQSHMIEAGRKALMRQKALLLVGEMGTGKTLMGMAAIHAHAAGRPYRALVFCPGQLVHKWEREIRETIPGANVIQIESWKNLLPLNRAC